MTSPDNIAVILLAAGRGQRFGADKLGAVLDGRPVVYHAASRLASLPFAHHIAVIGTSTPDLSIFGFSELRLSPAEAPMSRSIALGVGRAAGLGSRAVMIALADMPLVPESHFRSLVENFDGDRITTRVGDTTMPPAILAASHFRGLMALQGDRGAVGLLRNAPAVQLAPDLAIDIDRPGDLEQARQIANFQPNEHASERREH